MDKSLFNKIAVLQSKLKSTKENIEALENSDTGLTLRMMGLALKFNQAHGLRMVLTALVISL
jgi:hypothetical protein